MFRFKYYYKDGTTDLSDCQTDKPEELYNDFDGLIEWNEYDSLFKRKSTTKEILEIALRAYKDFLPDFYKIEIINDETNEVIDSIEEEK